LEDRHTISSKMAKYPNASLNPGKISGLCGRLMCWLKYENDNHEQAKRDMPDMGEKIITPYGAGYVTDLNLLEQVVQIKIIEEENIIDYTLDELIDQDIISLQATK